MSDPSGGAPLLERALVATRRPLAKRLIAMLRARGVETVVAFGAEEAEASWLEDAEYDAYLGDGPSERVWSEPQRLVSAAMDAGCDVLHPGAEPVAGSLDLWSAAAAANVGVVGGDPRRVPDVLDRQRWWSRARKLELPVLPVSEVLPEGADGVEEASRMGLPLFVKALHGPWQRRVDTWERLAAALAEVRAADPKVLLERAVPIARTVGVVVACDQHGTVAPVATTVTAGDGLWTAGAGGLAEDLAELVVRGTCRILADTPFVGVGRARWIIGADARPWLLDFAPRLPSTLELVEAASGVDLVALQLDLSLGARCPDLGGSRPAVQARCRATGEGTVAASRWSGAGIELHAGPGAPVRAGDLLAVATTSGDTTDEAWSRMRAALAAAAVSGVGCDLASLRDRAASR